MLSPRPALHHEQGKHFIYNYDCTLWRDISFHLFIYVICLIHICLCCTASCLFFIQTNTFQCKRPWKVYQLIYFHPHFVVASTTPIRHKAEHFLYGLDQLEMLLPFSQNNSGHAIHSRQLNEKPVADVSSIRCCSGIIPKYRGLWFPTFKKDVVATLH